MWQIRTDLNIKDVSARVTAEGRDSRDTAIYLSTWPGGREVTGKARQRRLTREVKECQVPGKLGMQAIPECRIRV